MLAVLDAVVTGEVVVEDGLFERVAMGGEDRRVARGVVGATRVGEMGEGAVEIEDDCADHRSHIAPGA